jgi:DNA polymerase (family 10)
MSSSARGPLSLKQGEFIAGRIVEEIRGCLKRIKIAGSIRRKRPLVNDIEIVAEPFLNEDLFSDTGTPVLVELMLALQRIGTIKKAGNRFIQVADVYEREGLNLDLFLVHPPAQWGSILAIRTGPAILGQYIVTKCRDFGYQHKEGHAVEIETGKVIPTETEEQFFALADVNLHPPEHRDDLALTLVTFQK